MDFMLLLKKVPQQSFKSEIERIVAWNQFLLTVPLEAKHMKTSSFPSLWSAYLRTSAHEENPRKNFLWGSVIAVSQMHLFLHRCFRALTETYGHMKQSLKSAEHRTILMQSVLVSYIHTYTYVALCFHIILSENGRIEFSFNAIEILHRRQDCAPRAGNS